MTKRKRKMKEKSTARQDLVNSSLYLETEEVQNNSYIYADLKPWERKHLRLLQWSYVHEGVRPRGVRALRFLSLPFELPTVKGCINLLEPVKCEESLVRMDQGDVKAVLKIMGHNWPKELKKRRSLRKNETKKRGTKALDELVDSIGKEEDRLVQWWKRSYCSEIVRKQKRNSPTSLMEPLFFTTFDEEERLWGFAERLGSAAVEASSNEGYVEIGRSTAGTAHKKSKKGNSQYKKKTKKKVAHD